MSSGDWQWHPLPGIEFPASLDGFFKTAATQYDRLGHDISVGYSWPRDRPDTKLTYFVYPAGDASDGEELGRAIRDVLQMHPGATALDHRRVLVSDLDGLGVDFRLPQPDTADRGLQSSVVLFKVDGWFVKVRATAVNDTPTFAAGVLAERLAHHIGGPTTIRRLDEALSRLAASSEASLAEVRTACQKDHATGSEPRTSLRQFLAGLERGEVLDAAELCKAMEEGGHPGVAVAQRALRAYLPVGVAFQGGIGATPWAPVVVSNTRTDDESVAACSAYVDCVLGPSGLGWSISRCDAVVIGGAIQDCIILKGPSGESVSLFFHVQTLEDAELPGASVIGSLDMAAQDGPPSIRLDHEVLGEAAPYVEKHLMCHAICHQIRHAVRMSR